MFQKFWHLHFVFPTSKKFILAYEIYEVKLNTQGDNMIVHIEAVQFQIFTYVHRIPLDNYKWICYLFWTCTKNYLKRKKRISNPVVVLLSFWACLLCWCSSPVADRIFFYLLSDPNKHNLICRRNVIFRITQPSRKLLTLRKVNGSFFATNKTPCA